MKRSAAKPLEPGVVRRNARALTVDCVRREGALGPSSRAIASVLRRAALAMGGVGGEVTVLICDDAEIALINARLRGKKGPTDVLAFPAGEEPARAGAAPLGDIAISWERAAAQARGAGRSLEAEMTILAVHGFLHLLGYDHESDDGEMLRLQARLLRIPGRRE